MRDTPQWGIEPVPDRLRVLGLLDTTLLWTNLGISLLVLVLPAYFDLPLRDALAATLVGGLIGNLMLAVAALIGADARVPTMVLQRAPLGRRGSYLPTALNVLQCLGWSSVPWPQCSHSSVPSASCAASSASSRSGRCSPP
jgi:purine-cytosine permease-like protein